MPEQFLNHLDISAPFQQVGGKFMPHGVSVKVTKPCLPGKLPYLV